MPQAQQAVSFEIPKPSRPACHFHVVSNAHPTSHCCKAHSSSISHGECGPWARTLPHSGKFSASVAKDPTWVQLPGGFSGSCAFQTHGVEWQCSASEVPFHPHRRPGGPPEELWATPLGSSVKAAMKPEVCLRPSLGVAASKDQRHTSENQTCFAARNVKGRSVCLVSRSWKWDTRPQGGG